MLLKIDLIRIIKKILVKNKFKNKNWFLFKIKLKKLTIYTINLNIFLK